MPLLIILGGIALLLSLILVFRFHAFIALILVALAVGISLGMPLPSVIKAIQNGVGGTLGGIALILGFGAMLGAVIAESGAAQRITDYLVDLFGPRWIQPALMLTGFIIGIPMFYTVAFIMLIPIIFSIAIRTKLPLLYVAIPMISALSVTHGFLPPHPAPTAIAELYGADLNLTLIYGLYLAVPTILIAGWWFGSTLRRFETPAPPELFKNERLPEDQLPAFGMSIFVALLPVLLMALGAYAKFQFPEGSTAYNVLVFIGNSNMALLIAVLAGVYLLALRNGRQMKDVMQSLGDAVKPIAIIMLIIAAGGAFKQVLVDSDAKEYIQQVSGSWNISPIFLAWLIAALLRVSLGSATVAAMTAGGIVAATLGGNEAVRPEILVLATGAGSLTASHVNDTGFWLFKEYFNLSIVQTLKTWTVMETIVSIGGLIGCFILDAIL